MFVGKHFEYNTGLQNSGPISVLWIQIIQYFNLVPCPSCLCTPDRNKVCLIWFTSSTFYTWKYNVHDCLSHVFFSFWLQLLSGSCRWCWTGCRRRFFCWSLRRRCLGLTGNATASRMQPIWRLKYQDLQGWWRRKQVKMMRDLRGSKTTFKSRREVVIWKTTTSLHQTANEDNSHDANRETVRDIWWCEGEKDQKRIL